MTQEELDVRLLEICESTEDRSKELKMLIILGADISFFNLPMISCCKARNLNHIKILVGCGVSINELLYFSARDGYLDGVKHALENGADVHYNNDCVLGLTCLWGHLDTVKFLVKKGANINANDNNALKLAEKNGHWYVVNYLKTLQKKENL